MIRKKPGEKQKKGMPLTFSQAAQQSDNRSFWGARAKNSKDSYAATQKRDKKRKKAETANSEADMPLFAESLRIEIDGYNQPRLLSAFQSEKITARNLKRLSQQKMRLDIAKKDRAKTFAILEKMCYNYSVVRSSGFSLVLRAALGRIGLVIGLAVFVAVFAFLQTFIWHVELTGFDNVSEQVLLHVLKEQNVCGGKPLSGIDKTAVRNALNGLNGILESTIEVSGTTVKVTVLESTDFAKPDQGSTTDLVSGYDAEITRIVTRQGTALVVRGQRIKAGTPLIGAYRLDGEGNKVELVSAKGEVYGRVAITKSLTFSQTEYISVATGKTTKNTILSLFGLKIGKSKNPYTHFVKRSETVDAFLGTFLPVKVMREIIEEVEMQQITCDPNQKAEALVQETVLSEVIGMGGNAIETSFTLTPLENGLYRLNVFIQAELCLTKI